MEKFYEKDGDDGWQEQEKRREMFHKSARFLVYREEGSDSISGFLHFRIELDNFDNPSEVVMYIYEVQVKVMKQGKGIGSLLIAECHRIAKILGLEAAYLTVFDSNIRARHLYEKIGYQHLEKLKSSTIMRKSLK